jgi:hypothetical protein
VEQFSKYFKSLLCLWIFGLIYLNLSTNIHTCETVLEILWNQLMSHPYVVFSLFHKLSRITYENNL